MKTNHLLYTRMNLLIKHGMDEKETDVHIDRTTERGTVLDRGMTCIRYKDLHGVL